MVIARRYIGYYSPVTMTRPPLQTIHPLTGHYEYPARRAMS